MRGFLPAPIVAVALAEDAAEVAHDVIEAIKTKSEWLKYALKIAGTATDMSENLAKALIRVTGTVIKATNKLGEEAGKNPGM